MSERPRSAGSGALVSTPGGKRPAKSAVSRRQFLQYTAIGAGALAVGRSVLAKPLQSIAEESLCASKVFFLPHLEIAHADAVQNGDFDTSFESPDIKLTATPDVNAPGAPP